LKNIFISFKNPARRPGVTDKTRGAGSPDSRSSRRGRHGVVGASIGLKAAPVPVGARQCEPKNHAGPQDVIEASTRKISIQTFFCIMS
jgi:hypothetical protein